MGKRTTIYTYTGAMMRVCIEPLIAFIVVLLSVSAIYQGALGYNTVPEHI